jgi:hypothetical protein
MSKRVIGLTTVALLFAFVVFAGYVWKDKKYTDWDEKDVAKILTDSPWAKSIPPGDLGAASTAPTALSDPHYDISGANNSNIGARVTAILYEFPEKNAGGQPAIPSDEKALDFVTELRQAGGPGGSGDSAKQSDGTPLPVKVIFDISKMSDAQGRDM